MKKNFFHHLFFFQVIIFLVGCANSKLHMELSIYKDDPLFKNVIIKDDIKATKLYLDDIETGLDNTVRIQVKVASKSFDLFSEYWMAQGEVDTLVSNQTFDDQLRKRQTDALKPLEDRLNDYIEQLYLKADEVKGKLDTANATYWRLSEMLPSELSDVDFTDSSYIGNLQRHQRLQQTLSIEVTQVYQSLSELLQDDSHPFVKSTKDNWNLISALINSQEYIDHLGLDRREKLNNSLKDIAELFKEVRSKLISLRPEIKDGADEIIKFNQNKILISSMMRNPTIYTLAPQTVSNMLKAVDLLNSQLDRLQIASSPVWRIVTDPSNKEKWNNEFSKTYFYAEGNAGVVVVRDSPIKYRMQEASNNPAALVQAQLQVSRAVADAAIQIAGARTGIPIVSETKTQDGEIQISDNKNETETVMTKQARLRAEKEIYQRSIVAMEANIDSYLRQLHDLKPADSNGDNDKDKINNLSLIIVQYLLAQQALLENTFD